MNTHYLRSWLSLLVLILLDRGRSRAPQQHTGEDDKDILIIIRQIVEGRR